MQPIKALVESAHLFFFARFFGPFRLFHIYFFVEVSMEKCCLDIKVIDVPIVCHTNVQYGSHGLKSCDGCKHLFEVNTRNLGVAFCHHPDLTMHDNTMLIVLSMAVRPGLDDSATGWNSMSGDQGEHVVSPQ